MTAKHLLRALATVSLMPLCAAPAFAQTTQGAQADDAGVRLDRPQNRTFVDLQAGVGYATNPELSFINKGSGYGRISASAFHGWGTERASTQLTGYVENTSYFQRYGNRQLFSLGASHSNRVSEKVTLFGNLSFSSDFGGQLSSRFFGIPVIEDVGQPVLPDNVVVVATPDPTALSQRQYRIAGSAGGSVSLSPRDSLSFNAGAQRIFFKGGNTSQLDNTGYDAAVGYNRLVNERLSAGARFIVSHTDYWQDRSILSYGPQLTGSLLLGERLQLQGAIGAVRTEQNLGPLGKVASTDLALDASLCRTLEFESFCGRVSRRTQSASIGTAPTSTSIGAEYARRLSAKEQVQANLAIVRSGTSAGIISGAQTFYTLAGSYDREIGNRLSAGVNVAARKLTVAGPDPKNDFSGSLFIRTRLGSVR